MEVQNQITHARTESHFAGEIGQVQQEIVPFLSGIRRQPVG